jgi:DNA adenine methylase
MQSEIAVQPFLKWAGGKRWLAPLLTKGLNYHYNVYIEPFLGSGSVFFALRPNTAILSDQNQSLINCYNAIKRRPDLVARYLREFVPVHDDKFYYEERDRVYSSDYRSAAQFLYLNRTCWNGLYRVNRLGKFNVPRGSKDSILLPTDDFDGVASRLAAASIQVSDFQVTMERAKKGDLIFADPPYTVKHNLNGFVKYNQNIFSWDDQIRLRDCAVRAAQRGATTIITNADHESIWELHGSADQMITLPRSSVISGKASGRGNTTEVLIVYGGKHLDLGERHHFDEIALAMG